MDPKILGRELTQMKEKITRPVKGQFDVQV